MSIKAGRAGVETALSSGWVFSLGQGGFSALALGGFGHGRFQRCQRGRHFLRQGCPGQGCPALRQSRSESLRPLGFEHDEVARHLGFEL